MTDANLASIEDHSELAKGDPVARQPDEHCGGLCAPGSAGINRVELAGDGEMFQCHSVGVEEPEQAGRRTETRRDREPERRSAPVV